MNEETAISILQKIDEETLQAITNFGSEYMRFLWWKEIIFPAIGIAIVIVILMAIYFLIISKAEDII